MTLGSEAGLLGPGGPAGAGERNGVSAVWGQASAGTLQPSAIHAEGEGRGWGGGKLLSSEGLGRTERKREWQRDAHSRRQREREREWG